MRFWNVYGLMLGTLLLCYGIETNSIALQTVGFVSMGLCVSGWMRGGK